MLRIRQEFEAPRVRDIPAEVRRQLELASGGEAGGEHLTGRGDSEALLEGIDTLGRPAWFDPFRPERPS